MFKVGDTVKCEKNYGGAVLKGWVGIIRHIDSSSPNIIGIEFNCSVRNIHGMIIGHEIRDRISAKNHGWYVPEDKLKKIDLSEHVDTKAEKLTIAKAVRDTVLYNGCIVELTDYVEYAELGFSSNNRYVLVHIDKIVESERRKIASSTTLVFVPLQTVIPNGYNNYYGSKVKYSSYVAVKTRSSTRIKIIGHVRDYIEPEQDSKKGGKKNMRRALVEAFPNSEDLVTVHDYMTKHGDLPEGFAGDVFIKNNTEVILEEAKRRKKKEEEAAKKPPVE